MQISNPKFVIELRNKSTLFISDQQAEIVDKAWTNKAPVTVNGAKINSVDITAIWPIAEWYEQHPDKKPAPQLPVFKIAEPKKPAELGEGYKHFVAMGKKLKSKFNH